MSRFYLSLRSNLGALDRFLRCLVPTTVIFLLGGCSNLAYYGQLAEGQWQLLRAREPVENIVADPATDPQLRQRLLNAEQARRFASDRLELPDNRSYRVYADLGRPFVVWNVFATPELSLEPVTHCFPIAGCVAYRGYYHQGAARGAAALLRQEGLDVFVGGVEAYSTLGWFDDPILSSMVSWSDERLASLIFHELSHQRLYVQDDTQFNESYATFVEQEGTRQWRTRHGLPAASQDSARQRDQFTHLVLASRERLERLYALPLTVEAKRAAKQEEFERLRREYRHLRDTQWGGVGRYDGFINGPLSNAKLLPFGLYDQWVPAFAALYVQLDGDWARFHERVEALGRLPAAQRKAALVELARQDPA